MKHERLTPSAFHRLILESFNPPPVPPLVVFDIDSTIMHTGYRNLRILGEAAGRWSELKAFTEKLDADLLGWNIRGTLRDQGLDDEDLLDRVHDFWKSRFFSDEYLSADRPYPGVREFIAALAGMGYRLLYLTGRDAREMKRGTRESFLTHKIPEGEFIFKPTKEMADLAFKKEAMKHIGRIGCVVAAVENEPANANLFKEQFPRAEVFLFDSITSPDPDEPRPDLRRFNEYREG